ncbi:MAG: DUF4133 domain-containing protein [Bacteroidetes bacterium]|nr:DUF4133 domain-containing protein [Bacteroidota bacterium]
MPTSIYTINKGINKPIEFKGLKAQYIWWLGGGIICLMVLFAVLYIAGVNSYVCIALVFLAGAAVFHFVYRFSNKYGEHGMKKKIARRSIPKVIKSWNRKTFFFENEK